VEIVIFLFALAAFAHSMNVFLKARSIRQWTPFQTKEQPSISVIICAHNEDENLRELLPRLIGQEYKHYEIIVVLDRCTDQSIRVLSELNCELIKVITIDARLPHIHPKKNGIAHAVQQAKGEWMLLTDADCRPENLWISEMAKAMHPDKEIVLGLSPYQKQSGWLNQLIQYETFVTALHFISAGIRGKTYMALGRNLAYRKSLFLDAGGFGAEAKTMGGDDDLLIQRLATPSNVNICLTHASHVVSIPETNWTTYFRQKTRHFAVSSSYNQSAKMSETWRWLCHLGMWILFIPGLLVDWQLTVVFFVGSCLIKTISINIVADRLGKRFNHLWLPFVDLTYVLVMPLIRLRSLLVKRITWK
jgi:cellulose synthase/poly-beta-1,6-N-acetylglucosamine synthase-like glycosyltransferase